MDLFLILYEVLEEEKGKCSFSVARQYPDDPFQIEGENRIHVWFTVIFFPSGVLSCIRMRVEEG